jgi:hypothetical protein
MAMPVWEVHAFLRALNRDKAIANADRYSATAIAFGSFSEESARAQLNSWSTAIKGDGQNKPKNRVTAEQAAQNVRDLFAVWGR